MSTTLGNAGPQVPRLGLGCMGMSGMRRDRRGRERRDDPRRTRSGHESAGHRDFYGMGHNEMLIARALEGDRRNQSLISVKFGAQRAPDNSWLGYDARPAAVKTWLAYSLKRLRTDHIDIYRPARLDSQVPIEETIGAIAEMVQAGYVRYIGLSEVGAETIRRAAAVHPICDLQIEYSLISRGIEPEILPACRELGIGITAYGILSRGLISGHGNVDRQLSPSDFRSRAPRFQGGNLERVPGREPGAQPRPRRGPPRGRRGPGGDGCPGRDRVGAEPRRGHRPADRRPTARSARRGARRARAHPQRRGA